MQNQKLKNFLTAFQKVSKQAESLTLDEGRKLSTQFFLASAFYEPVEEVKDEQIEARDGHQMPVRLYFPERRPLPYVLLYFHGGGFVYGSIEDADPVCRKLANHLGFVVASIEYRLAPEHPFPKPLHDCYDALCWAANRFKEGVIVAGESAGGNLAAACAMMARDQKGPSVAAQLLFYPAIKANVEKSPYERSQDRSFITEKAMKYFWSAYLHSPEDYRNPYASLDQAKEYLGLPQAFIVTAEHDPLHEEGELYAQLLQEAHVKVIVQRIPNAMHSFLKLPIYDEEQKNRWLDGISAALKGIL